MHESSVHIDNLHAAVSGRVGLWVPSERVSIHRLPRPAAPRRKWRQLLPWLLEEQLLSPVETVHAVLLAEEDDSLLVAAVSHEDIDAWLSSAAQAGLRPETMVPDFLALPWQPGTVSLALRQPREAGHEPVVVVRHGQWQGFAAPPGVIEGLLAAVASGDPSPGRVFYMPPDQIPAALAQEGEDCRGEVSWHQPLPREANLLQGEYEPKPANGPLSTWWPVAALLLLAVGLGWGTLVVGNRTLATELSALDQSRLNWFRTLFPDAARPADNRVYPERPADLPPTELATHGAIEELVRVRFAQRERMQTAAMAVMTAMDPVLSRCDCDLEELTVSEEGADLVFAAGDADSLLATLSDLPGHRVSVTERGDEDRIRLRVTEAQR